MSRRNRTVKQATRTAPKFRLAPNLAFVAAAFALGVWLMPARAQHGDAAPPPPPPDTPVHAPATDPHAPAAGAHVPGDAPAHGTLGDAHTPGAEPAAGAHDAEGGHGVAGGHDAAGGHAEGGHGEGEHSEGVSIHQPTWISTPLKKLWWSGPASITVGGAVTLTGEPVPAESLVGKQIAFTYVDDHSHATPKPEVPIHPTVTKVGDQRAGSDVKLVPAVLDGQDILLIKPEVSFTYASMFPELWVISMMTALCIALCAFVFTRNLKRVPGKMQALLEVIYESLDTFVHGLIGDHYKRYLPLVGTIFIYVLIMNLSGIIPGWGSPTANINVPAGLALVVVVFVQYEGIRANGIKGYLMHFVGDPWWLGPLNFPIHAVGELARLLSLTIRLFGNIFGEDVVIVILIFLAGMFTKGLVPFQAPMYLLAMFTSFVQAMVFSILTCVYIALMTTHDESHGHAEHGHDEHGAHHHDGHAPVPAV